MSANAVHITAIVLASGLGSRFGGDKLLKNIPYNKDLALPIGLISALNVRPHVDQVICVVRPHDIQLQQLFQIQGFQTIDNPNFKEGLSSSIRTGVLACAKDSHYLICLGDMPYIQSNTYQSLITRFLNHTKDQTKTIARPMFNENHKQGHPVIFSNDFKKALLSLSGDNGGKSILKKNDVLTVNLNDHGILDDIDYPENIRAE